MRRFTTRELTFSALVAALYAALTVALPIPQYGSIQVRLAEAMTVLPFLFPAATSGLVAGCFLANLFSPYPLDLLCGTAATLIACLLTRNMPSRWLAPLPPILCNALLVGAEVAWFETGFGPGFSAAFVFHILSVGAGELLACGILGSILLTVLPGVPVLRPCLARRHQKAAA